MKIKMLVQRSLLAGALGLCVAVPAQAGTLIATGVGPKSFLLAMVQGKLDLVTAGLDQAASSIRHVLQGQG